jgi:hypothetical protein
MNDRLVVLACVALCHLLGASLAPQLDTRASASQVAKPSPYFGQALPTLSPERFAPGVVSTDAT